MTMRQGINEIYYVLEELFDNNISEYEESFLVKSMENRCAALNCMALDDYMAILIQNGEEAKTFLESLRISYSEFFRNRLTFAVLENLVLPGIISENLNKNKKLIRFWSAACAAGQETYSLGILLEEMRASHPEKFQYLILGTDKNGALIDQAKLGRYADYEVGNLPVKLFRKWFAREGEINSVVPALHLNINFSQFDLLDNNYASPPSGIFGEYDLIFCANVLFYYKEKYRTAIIEKLLKNLAPGGYIVTGEAERDIFFNLDYQEIIHRSAIFKKT